MEPKLTQHEKRCWPPNSYLNGQSSTKVLYCSTFEVRLRASQRAASRFSCCVAKSSAPLDASSGLNKPQKRVDGRSAADRSRPEGETLLLALAFNYWVKDAR
jgi:hypothetical protein